MIPAAVRISGREWRLGRRIGRGGEGHVFLLAEDESVAVKIYTLRDLGDRPAKVRALLGARLAEQVPLVAFPTAEVSTSDGRFAGFAMRFVDGHQPLHELYAPGPRKIHFPSADYRFLVRTASNISAAIAAVHRNGCVIGDINHSSILVSAKALVALIDADSFQFVAGGSRFFCRVGVPEYTPPELQGLSLAAIQRTPDHDAFGLAVVIFQLLFMGRHPFVGTVRRGDLPPIHENIARHRYVYTDSRDVGMDQPPGTPSIAQFGPELSRAFDSAFLEAGNRPTAEHWVRTLKTLEDSLVKCDDNPLHHVPKAAPECPWCEMERRLNTVLFLPWIPMPKLGSGVDPGAITFDVVAIWGQIEAARAKAPLNLTPPAGRHVVVPSDAAKRARAKASRPAPIGVALIGAAAIAFVTMPSGLALWVFVAFIGYHLAKPKPLDAKEFIDRYTNSERGYLLALEDWYRRCGLREFEAAFQKLHETRRAYDKAVSDEVAAVEKLSRERKEQQLRAHLTRFSLARTKLKGIGPSTRALLASYGLDTAAEMNESRLLAVPGIGPVLAKRLVAWRGDLERHFTYQPQLTDAERAAVAYAHSVAELQKKPLRAELAAGAQWLLVISERIRKAAAGEDPALQRAKQQRDAHACDLEFLRLPLPQVSRPSAPAPGLSQLHPVPPPKLFNPTAPSGAAQTTSPRCPRCNQTMVRRVARRGVNAGGPFWGCSRYPLCKGTRQI